MDSTSMTPADFSAMIGNVKDNDFGNSGAWWIIILFLFFMNGGMYGNNTRSNGQLNQYATAASQQDILFGQKFSDLDNKIDKIGNGIADATYALNNVINGVQTNVTSAINTEGRTLQSQVAEANYNNRLATAQMSAQIDRQTGLITTAIHSEGQQTRAMMQANEIQALRDKVSTLEADNRMAGVVRYPMSYAYSAGQSPFCNCNCNGNI